LGSRKKPTESGFHRNADFVRQSIWQSPKRGLRQLHTLRWEHFVFQRDACPRFLQRLRGVFLSWCYCGLFCGFGQEIILDGEQEADKAD
jgi:hypothetical protein